MGGRAKHYHRDTSSKFWGEQLKGDKYDDSSNNNNSNNNNSNNNSNNNNSNNNNSNNNNNNSNNNNKNNIPCLIFQVSIKKIEKNNIKREIRERERERVGASERARVCVC